METEAGGRVGGEGRGGEGGVGGGLLMNEWRPAVVFCD